jgi:superfamily I DNA/RNA helicase
MFTHSKYQLGLFNEIEEGTGNILVKAVAGSSKTYSIVESLNHISPMKSIAFFAFNTHIVEELKTKTPSYVDITTLHSFGWRHMQVYYRGVKLNPNKVYQYCEKLLKFKIKAEDRGWYFMTIVRLIELIKFNITLSKNKLLEMASLHNMDYITEEILKDAINVFHVTLEDKRQFDFTDMIYVPAILDDIRIKQYDIVFVDECQDLSIAQQQLLYRAVKRKGGRLIAVGDPRQAIYGFAGSDAMSFKRLEERPNTTILPLSVCYRCAKEIVYKAQEIVDEIEPYEESPEGVYRTDGKIHEMRRGDWVLCRNVKPLIILYIDLITKGKSAHIKGEDIGRSIIALLKQTKQKSMDGIISKLIDKYKQVRADLAKKGHKNLEKHPKLGQLQEHISIIMFLSEKFNTVAEVEKAIGRMFKDKGDGILLSTIHKAKGLENDRVFLICLDLIPSKYAIKPWQIEQEENLLYVAYTRAKKELIVVDDFRDSVEDFLSKARANKKQLNTELLR